MDNFVCYPDLFNLHGVESRKDPCWDRCSTTFRLVFSKIQLLSYFTDMH